MHRAASLGGRGALSPACSSAVRHCPRTGFLADVDLLTRADEPHEHIAAGDALAAVHERLGLALGERQTVLRSDLLEVPGALRLVVDDDVLRWHRLVVAERRAARAGAPGVTGDRTVTGMRLCDGAHEVR